MYSGTQREGVAETDPFRPRGTMADHIAAPTPRMEVKITQIVAIRPISLKNVFRGQFSSLTEIFVINLLYAKQKF